MSTAQEIENAIRSLSAAERDKLLHHIPDIFPEIAGDNEWERLISDERPRPELTDLLNQHEAELTRNPESYPKMTASDFGSPA
jgi:2-oxo-4-hydroxy-4-carboxy--5-ureidoimidazoline (OHCU) decarboxylase